jgi:hypothetical protein
MPTLTRIAATALAASAFATAGVAAPVQWTVASGGNDHWYEYIQTPLVWSEARTAALASTHLGLGGYLATVTSAEENRFIANTFNGALAWLGGSDAGSEGDWRWMDGPEAGQAFTFTAWEPGEPNDVGGGEDYLQINWASFSGWNDHGGPGIGVDQANGYVIEYGPTPTTVPEPASLALVLPALLAAAAVRRRRR